MQTPRHLYETSPKSSRGVVVELQAEPEPSLLQAKWGTPGQLVAHSSASLGRDPEKLPSFCRQKLKLMGRLGWWNILCICKQLHPIPRVLVDSNSCKKGLYKLQKDSRGASGSTSTPPHWQAEPHPALCEGVGWPWSPGLWTPHCLLGLNGLLLILPCTSVSPPVKWVEIRCHLRLVGAQSDALFDYKVD